MKTLHHLLQRHTKLAIGVLLLADGLFFAKTDPQEISSVAIIGAFVLVAATAYVAVLYLLKLPEWYGIELGTRNRRVALTVSAAICSLLAMRSVNQLGMRDVMVLVPLSCIAYFYLHYARRLQPERA